MQQLGIMQLSVKRQLSYCNKPFPEGSTHSHLKEGYVSPQQVSLPVVQTEPSSEHDAPMSQVSLLAAGLLDSGGGSAWIQVA